MMKFLRVIAALAFLSVPAAAQVVQVPSGDVLGNPTAARAPSQPASLSAIIDRAISSTQGAMLYRNGTIWTSLSPGTAGLPLLSGGAGANLAYGILGLSAGGTNANLTASNGGIFYSDATKAQILSGTATALQMLQSGASGAPAWSTTTWPATSTINRILFSSAANVIGEIATVNGGVMNAGATGSPAMTVTPVIGVPGTSTGTIGLAGITSGTATITAQAAAGTPTLTLPTGSGTFAVSVSAPLALNATTGALSITGAAGQVLAGATPAFTATPTLGANGGTGGQITLNGSTSGSVALRVAAAAGTSTVFQFPANNGTNTYVLQTDGAGNTSWVASAGGGTVTSITCAATLTCTASNPITTTGTVALNLSNANSWASIQTFPTSDIHILGSSTGYTAIASANAGASNFTATLQAASGTLAYLDLADQTVAGGANVTPLPIGTIASGGSITVDCGSRPVQWFTNGSSGSGMTINAPSNDGSCMIEDVNGASAGPITFTGFTVGAFTGATIDTTNTHKFTISVWRINGTSGYAVYAHQ